MLTEAGKIYPLGSQAGGCQEGPLKDEGTPLATPEEIIDEARNGRMFILVDDEDRENEGDLVFHRRKFGQVTCVEVVAA